MKKNKLLKIFILIAGLMISSVGWGQSYLINEGFESTTFPPTGWINSGCIRTTNNPRNGDACLGLMERMIIFTLHYYKIPDSFRFGIKEAQIPLSGH